MSRFLGITREPVFSPGKVADDHAILETVADELRARGNDVSVIDADAERWPEPTSATIVFAMSQGARALERLSAWHARGIRIINRPAAILNCQRYRTIAAFSRQSEVAFPESVLVSSAAAVPLPAWIAEGGAWVKRGDVHATETDDVVFVDSAAAARAALQRFRLRRIEQAVIQRHVPGTVVKFYAVRGRFFYCVRAAKGDEIPTPVVAQLNVLGRRAAETLGVEIYGGDCVYSAPWGLTLIDLNDWPSYAPCRVRAAGEIAVYLHAQKVATDT